MVRGLIVAAALAVGLIAGPAHARVADHNPHLVNDPTGDSGAAPDITRVSAANSLAGEILFFVQVANRQGLQSGDVVAIPIDSDQSATTGEPDGDGGIDYVILIHARLGQVFLLRWNGTDYDPVQGSSVRAEFASGYVALIHRRDLGNTGAFSFYVDTFLEGGGGSDSAPQETWEDYRLATPHIDTIAPSWSSPLPRAGTTWRVTAVQLLLDSDERVAAASYSCRATLGGKRIRGTGRGGCTFRLPKTARGKRFVVTITASPPGGEAQTFRPVTFRIR